VPINTKILGATTVILPDTEFFSKLYNCLNIQAKIQANVLANIQAKKKGARKLPKVLGEWWVSSREDFSLINEVG